MPEVCRRCSHYFGDEYPFIALISFIYIREINIGDKNASVNPAADLTLWKQPLLDPEPPLYVHGE